AVLGVTLKQKDFSMTKEKGKTAHITCEVTGLSTDYVHWYQKKDGEEALKRILYVKQNSPLVPDNTHSEAGDFK
ncbi:T-cell receptor gamma, partial [Clarias magur]